MLVSPESGVHKGPSKALGESQKGSGIFRVDTSDQLLASQGAKEVTLVPGML